MATSDLAMPIISKFTAATNSNSVPTNFHSSQTQLEEKSLKCAETCAECSLCTFETLSGNSFLGNLCKTELNKQELFLFIATVKSLHHITSEEFCNAILHSQNVSTPLLRNFHCVWVDLRHKSLVVELSAEIANEFKRRGAKFLKSGVARPNEEVHFYYFFANYSSFILFDKNIVVLFIEIGLL